MRDSNSADNSIIYASVLLNLLFSRLLHHLADCQQNITPNRTTKKSLILACLASYINIEDSWRFERAKASLCCNRFLKLGIRYKETEGINMEKRPAALSISSADGDTRRRNSSSASQSGHLITSFGQRKPSHGNPHFHVGPRKSSVSPRAERVDTAASGGRLRGQVDVQPSYRMGPHPDKKFRPNAAKKIMDEVLDEALELLSNYDPVKCRSLTTQVCEDIKQKVKWLNFERCKLICLVYFGSLNGQGLRVASQCLWDHNVDNFASTTRTKADVFATALLFGVYKE